MFYILFSDENGRNTWDLVSGEDAMQIRVSELVDAGIDPDYIIVFSSDSELV